MADTPEIDRSVGGPPRRARPTAGNRSVEGASALFRANRSSTPGDADGPAAIAPAPATTQASEAPVQEVGPPEPAPAAAAAVYPISEDKVAAPPADVVAPPPALTHLPERRPERKSDPKVTVSVDPDTHGRLQAAYKLARMRGGEDITWREWCLNALLAEATRVERSYNGGEPLQGDGRKLRSGRPVGS